MVDITTPDTEPVPAHPPAQGPPSPCPWCQDEHCFNPRMTYPGVLYCWGQNPHCLGRKTPRKEDTDATAL